MRQGRTVAHVTLSTHHRVALSRFVMQTGAKVARLHACAARSGLRVTLTPRRAAYVGPALHGWHACTLSPSRPHTPVLRTTDTQKDAHLSRKIMKILYVE